jgi:hypothetical protein
VAVDGGLAPDRWHGPPLADYLSMQDAVSTPAIIIHAARAHIDVDQTSAITQEQP